MPESCPLCHSPKTSEYFENKRRRFLQCQNCDLVFVPSRFHVTQAEERRIYDLHENDCNDQGYRRFLSRLSIPLIERLSPNQKGLDFGCGPGPALAQMLEEEGHQMSLFDLYYHNAPKVLENSYDFICATEVIEHLKQPGIELENLVHMLHPNGILALMTKLVINREAFAKWHYIQDPTHICFFSRKTFLFLADRLDCHLQFIDRDVIFLQRP